MMKNLSRFLLLILITVSNFLFAQNQVTVFTGATIIPVIGGPITDGVLVVHRGKILSVSSSSAATVPTGAQMINVTGKVIMPGMVDTHSHLGSGDGGDRSNALHPEVRIMDAIDPMSDNFYRAKAGGITTLNVMPGSGHLMSGQTVYLKMRPGKLIEDILICEGKDPVICGGMKMANGTNSIRTEPPFPGTRAKSAALARELFVKAVEYKNKKSGSSGDLTKMPDRDLQMEALVEVLDGKRIVHFHSHRQDDIMTAIRLSREFGFKVVLHHVSEGWKVADEIAKAGVSCSIILVDSPGGKLEAISLNPGTGAILERAGAEVGFHTDDPITDSRLFLRSAAIAVREGMTEQKALEGLTIAGARMLALEHRIGSIEKGKDADFLVLSGDPFSVYTKIEQTWVEGQKVFDLSNPEDKKFAVGGYQVYRDRLIHVHD